MMDSVFDKTDKGREEIATRRYRLASRLRTLLVLIDGKHSAAELLITVEGLGINQDSLDELLSNGFIAECTSPALQPASAMAETEPLCVPEPEPAMSFPDTQSQFLAIYRFFNDTIKSMIGLRGYGLQLKVERAATIDDFRKLRHPYLDAVLKAKGGEIERSLRVQLDQLLHAGIAERT